jgi:hypothetical protein
MEIFKARILGDVDQLELLEKIKSLHNSSNTNREMALRILLVIFEMEIMSNIVLERYFEVKPLKANIELLFRNASNFHIIDQQPLTLKYWSLKSWNQVHLSKSYLTIFPPLAHHTHPSFHPL